MQSKLSLILDTLFLSVISFIITFSTLQVFIESKLICLILASIVFILSIKLILPKTTASWNKKYTSIQEHKHIEKCRFSLQTMKNDDILALFSNIFEKNFSVTRFENYLIIDNKTLIGFDYLSEKLEKRFVLDCYITATKLNLQEIAIFTEKQSQETLAYAKNLSTNIFFFDISDTYALMKKVNIYPINKDIQTKQSHFAFFKNISLNKKKARSFLFTSFLLYFSSLFIPFTSYYLIFAALSLILSIVCFSISEPKTEPYKSYLLQNKKD